MITFLREVSPIELTETESKLLSQLEGKANAESGGTRIQLNAVEKQLLSATIAAHLKDADETTVKTMAPYQAALELA